MLGTMKEFNSSVQANLADLLKHKWSWASRALTNTFLLYFGLSLWNKLLCFPSSHSKQTTLECRHMSTESMIASNSQVKRETCRKQNSLKAYSEKECKLAELWQTYCRKFKSNYWKYHISTHLVNPSESWSWHSTRASAPINQHQSIPAAKFMPNLQMWEDTNKKSHAQVIQQTRGRKLVPKNFNMSETPSQVLPFFYPYWPPQMKKHISERFVNCQPPKESCLICKVIWE